MTDFTTDSAPARTLPAPTVLTIEALDLRWPQAALFSGLDWQVPAGVALVQGGAASGKTTLLRLLAGVLPPTRGRILLQGQPVRSADVFWAEAQAAGSDQWMVRDAWAKTAARFVSWDNAALARHVDGFALAPHQDKQFFMLSAGTRRKVWLAAALASGAPLTLIDEPLAGLDLASARYLTQALSPLAEVAAEAEEGDPAQRVVVVAHDGPLEGVPWTAQLRLPDAPDA